MISAIAFVGIYLIHGVNAMSTVALASTLAALGVTVPASDKPSTTTEFDAVAVTPVVALAPLTRAAMSLAASLSVTARSPDEARPLTTRFCAATPLPPPTSITRRCGLQSMALAITGAGGLALLAGFLLLGEIVGKGMPVCRGGRIRL